jgi:DNA polymerase III epsilon subunit-like protein
MATQHSTVYCSLDLEFTGFDPSKDQILEVAFVLFMVSEAGVQITERWSSLFRPSIPVPAKVLGLTHLTMAELEAAPSFADQAPWLQEKLQNVVFVGHNLTLDLKFLEAFGIQLSDTRVIDTLDLVQWLLPTYHSYNLENVARFLGVVHTDAHRALADCEAAIGVLEKLLAHYRALPANTQADISTVLSRAFPHVVELLAVPGPAVAIATPVVADNTLSAVPAWPVVEQFPAVITNAQAAVSPVGLVQAALAAHSDVVPLVLLPHTSAVMAAWRLGLGQPVLAADQSVDLVKVAQFIAAAQSSLEVLFAAKLLVWQATNWQTQTHSDLNTSFAGHQFIATIIADETAVEYPQSGPLLVDYAGAISLPAIVASQVTSAVVIDVVRFEQWLSHHGGVKWSWQRILSKLKAIYDPERVFPYDVPVPLATKTVVTEALAATDLFFGLLHLELKPWQHLGVAPVTDIAQNPFKLHKLEKAAHTLAERLALVAAAVPESGLDFATSYIRDFFIEGSDPVKWVDFGLRHTVLLSRPVELSLGSFAGVVTSVPTTFVDCVGNSQALAYALTRLQQPVVPPLPWLQAVGASIAPQPVPAGDVFGLIKGFLEAHEAVVLLFPTVEVVKDFYDAHYEALGAIAHVWAQGYSGGQNKILRNFSALGQGLLVATPEFIARQHMAVPAQRLVLSQLSHSLVADPYTRAVVARYGADFPELATVWHETMLEQLTHMLTGLQTVHEVKS